MLYWPHRADRGAWVGKHVASSVLHRGVIAVVAGLLGFVAVTAVAQQSPLQREAAAYTVRGQTDAVLRLFAETAKLRQSNQPLERGPWTAAEAVVLAAVWQRRGDIELAKSVLKPWTQGKQADSEAMLAWATLLRASAPFGESLQFLAKAAPAWPQHVRLRVAWGEVLYETGKAVEARQLLDPLAELYQDNKVHEVADLVAVARSLQLNGYPRDALTVLQKAEESADQPADVVVTQLALGELFVDKYNYRDGDKALKQVLAIDPFHPRALSLMARIDLQSDHDVARARKRIDGLLQRQPKSLDGLLLRAEIALWDEDLAAAGRYLASARHIRGDWLPARYVEGARCLLADDAKCWAEIEAAVRKINKDDGRLYLIAATWLELNHRYREARQLLETALRRDPELWQAHAALGMAYAREADDGQAKKALETAYSGDPFDVRTANQLSVLYDDVLPQMQLLPGRSADLRVAKKERKALERTVLPFLQDAVDQLAGLYGFVPKRPLQVEIFPELQQFSVRTVGLPQLGAHAVCFGHLVTSRSPVAEPFNWKLVLYHELAHVFHLQATGGRVPRWLTEGLAMMEAAWADPRWQSHGDRAAWDRLHDGELAHLETFNLAFSQARSMRDILAAYDQAMREVAFLAERFGAARVRKLVAAHQGGKPTAQLIREVLGEDPAALDRAFATWLGVQLQRYARDYRPTVAQTARRLGIDPKQHPVMDDSAADPSAVDDEAAGEAEGADMPADSQTLAQPPEGSDTPLRRALRQAVQRALHGHHPAPVLAPVLATVAPPPAQSGDWQDFCAAHALLLERAARGADRKQAADHAQALVDQPQGRCDGVRQRLVLATLAKGSGEPVKAVQHLQAAMRIDPTDESAAQLLGETVALASEAIAVPEGRAAPWLAALAPDGLEGLWRHAEIAARSANHDSAPVVLLAQLAWWRWQRAPQKGPERSRLAADVATAQAWLEERDPASRLAALYEARSHVARAQPAMALPAYRLAAERARNAAERAEAWCEAVSAAAAAQSREEQAEAERRCAADKPAEPRRPQSKPAAPASGGIPPGGT